MLKTILFDLDDTLLDFRRAEAEALAQTLRRFQINPTPALLARYHDLNRRQWELLEEGRLTRTQVKLRRFDLLFGELGADCDSREVAAVYEAALSQGSFLLPGARALLETLSPCYDLYLASNGSSAVQHSRLARSGILPYFKGIFISEELPANKPDSAFFHACFAAIPDFDLASAILVGDSLTSDIRGAQGVGLRSVWYAPSGALPPDDPAPDYVLRSLAALPPLLETL